MKLLFATVLLVQYVMLEASGREKRLVLHSDMDIAQELVDLKAEMTALNNTYTTDIDILERRYRSELAAFTANVTNTIQALDQRFVLAGSGPVAFHAVNTQGPTTHVGSGEKILYDRVNVNLGAGYHSQHGLFIAPRAGLYMFSTSIMTFYQYKGSVQVSLMKNGVVLARAYGKGEGESDQGSVTLVTQLVIGDEVWVSKYNSADITYYGDYFTSFMGCMLWPS